MSRTETYEVTGMTCEHCVSAVRSEVSALPGVEDVAIDLVKGGASSVVVRSGNPLDRTQVRGAVEEAGYELVDGPVQAPPLQSDSGPGR